MLVLNTILFAMFTTVGVFFFLAQQVAKNTDVAPVETPITMVFLFLAVSCAAMSFVLPMMLHHKEPKNKTKRQPIPAAKLFVPAILRFSFSETVAIFGYLASFQTREFETFVPFGVASLMLMIVHWLIIQNQSRV